MNKEKYLNLLNNYICSESNYWGNNDQEQQHQALAKISQYRRNLDYSSYDNKLDYNEIDVLSALISYNNYSNKNWSIDTILEKLESVIERKVR